MSIDFVRGFHQYVTYVAYATFTAKLCMRRKKYVYAVRIVAVAFRIFGHLE